MKINIEIDDEQARLINEFIEATRSGNGLNGDLTIATLAEMLLDDVALVVRRPGCWEAGGMGGLLASHGYEYM